MPVSATENSPFMFSKIPTIDDAYMNGSADSEVGEITLLVWTTRWVTYRKARPSTSTSFVAPFLWGQVQEKVLGRPIHEKSKKVGQHCTRSALDLLICIT